MFSITILVLLLYHNAFRTTDPCHYNMKLSWKYLPVADQDTTLEPEGRKSEAARAARIRLGIFFSLLALTNTLTAVVVAYRPWHVLPRRAQTTYGNYTHSNDSASSDVYPITEDLPPTYSRFRWWTAWGLLHPNSTDLESADPLWDSTLPSHGLIAVDRTWAQEHRWPVSMFQPKFPAGQQRGVYMLEAYHMMHCLSIVRRSFQEARRRQPLTFEPRHSIHCFDAIRQSILCHADNTPLYTFGQSMAGEGQLRKCRSWDALRDYATKNTACYRDPEGGDHSWTLEDHFGHCEEGKEFDDGEDGFT